MQPKKQLKVQIIGILEEIYFFYWPKMHLWKGDKKFGQRPSPPPHLDKIQKNSSIFREIFPQMFYVQLFMSPSQSELVYTILLKLC